MNWYGASCNIYCGGCDSMVSCRMIGRVMYGTVCAWYVMTWCVM